MNFYEWHIGDWLKKCAHLTAQEEGVYRRLLDWYYSHEAPIPLSMRDAYRAARCSTPQERKCVQRVLHEFFELMPDGWHQNRADKSIAAYRNASPVAQVARIAAKERSARAREKRSKLFNLLAQNGITPAWNATTAELEQICFERDITAPVTAHVTPSARDDTANKSHKPTPHAVTTRVTGDAVPCEVTAMEGVANRAGAVCALMKAQGLNPVNPADPRLLNLLHEGASDDEFKHTAAEAVALGKGWGWTLATVKGRRDEATGLTKKPQQGPKSGRGRTNGPDLGAWMPALVATTPKPSADGEVIDVDA